MLFEGGNPPNYYTTSRSMKASTNPFQSERKLIDLHQESRAREQVTYHFSEYISRVVGQMLPAQAELSPHAPQHNKKLNIKYFCNSASKTSPSNFLQHTTFLNFFSLKINDCCIRSKFNESTSTYTCLRLCTSSRLRPTKLSQHSLMLTDCFRNPSTSSILCSPAQSTIWFLKFICMYAFVKQCCGLQQDGCQCHDMPDGYTFMLMQFTSRDWHVSSMSGINLSRYLSVGSLRYLLYIIIILLYAQLNIHNQSTIPKHLEKKTLSFQQKNIFFNILITQQRKQNLPVKIRQSFRQFNYFIVNNKIEKDNEMVVMDFFCEYLGETYYSYSKYYVGDTYINDYLVDREEEVAELEKQFEGKQVKELELRNIVFSEKGIKRLLQMDVSCLESLVIADSILGQKAAKVLFNHSLFPRLQQLRLDFCSLQDEAFSEFQPMAVSLRNFSLSQSYLTQKGFQQLALLNFTQLQDLNLSGNSLYHNESVEYLLSLDLSQIKGLNVGDTSISEENLLKLLHRVNIKQMYSLTLSKLDLQWDFWKKFSQLEFPNLERFIVNEVLIDQNSVPFLSQMRFPKLKFLIIDENDLTSTEAIQLINKNTMPLLNDLSISNNFINSTFIQHLVEEDYKLKGFFCHVKNMDKNTIPQLTRLDFNEMESFSFKDNTVSPSQMHQFITQKEFPALKSLTLTNLVHSGNIFGLLLQGSFPSLQKLLIENKMNTYYSELSLENRAYFPKLTSLQFLFIDENYIKDFIINISIFAPSIRYIRFHEDLLVICSQIIESKIEKIVHPITFQMVTLSWMLKPESFPFLIKDLFERFSAPATKFNLSLLNTIAVSSAKNINLLEEYSKRNPDCVFKNLEQIDFTITNQQQLRILQRCQYPYLKQIQIHLYFHKAPDQDFLFLSNELFSNVNKIKISSRRNLNDMITKNLVLFQSQRLTGMDLTSLSLEDRHLHKLIKQMYNFNHLKSLTLSRNYIFEKNDIKFDFHNLRLAHLQITKEAIGKNLKKLQTLNTEFLQVLILRGAGIYDENFINFLIYKKNQMKGFVFPKISHLDISQNYIQSEGMNQLFASGIPRIDVLLTRKIQDPQLFNTIFSSRFSRKIKVFETQQNYLDSIDPNINPAHTRRLVDLYIPSKSLVDEDYKALANFDFFSLNDIELTLFNVNQCETLKSLLKIVRNANIIFIDLVQEDNLHSFCLQNLEEDYEILKPQYFEIEVSSSYTHLKYFIEKFFPVGIQLEELYLPSTYISDEKLLQISDTADFSGIYEVDLSQNNLTDVSVASLFPKLIEAQSINLHMNQYLTGNCLANIGDKSFPNLLFLDLSQTLIGDKGIEYLLKACFPFLKYLYLGNAQITEKGLEKLSELNAPFLKEIDLSCNKLSASSIMKFSARSFPELHTIILYPDIDIKEYELLVSHFSSEKFGIQIKIKSFISYRSQTES